MQQISRAITVAMALMGAYPTFAHAGMPMSKLIEKMGRSISEKMKLSERIATRAEMPVTWIRDLDANAEKWSVEDKFDQRLPEIRFQLPQGLEYEATAPATFTFEKGHLAEPLSMLKPDLEVPKVSRVQCSLVDPVYEVLKKLVPKSKLKSKDEFRQYRYEDRSFGFPKPVELDIGFVKNSAFGRLKCTKIFEDRAIVDYITVKDVERAFGDYVFFIEIPDDIFFRFIGYKWILRKYAGHNKIEVSEMLRATAKAIGSKSSFTYENDDIRVGNKYTITEFIMSLFRR